MRNPGSDLTKGRQGRFFYGYIVVAATCVIYMVVGGAFSSFGIFFKPLIAEFGWTRAMTSGTQSLSALSFGLLSIIAGRLNDRFGPRFIMIGSSILLGLGYFMMSQISAIWQLYLFYGVIASAGMGAIIIPLASTVVRWFIRKRGMMAGIVGSGIGLGNVIAPPVVSRLIIAYGWRTSYVVVGVTAFILIMIAAQFLKRDPGEIGQSPYGADETKIDISNIDTSGHSLQQAVCSRQFWTYFAILFCGFLSVDTIIIHIVPHATDMGIPATSAAYILTIIGGLSVAGRLVAGSISDRIGNKPALIGSFILISMALFWLLNAKSMWALSLFGFVFGIGRGGTGVLMSPIVAWLFGLRSLGVVLGVITIGATLGSMIGPFLAGYIFDATGSYDVALMSLAILSTLGLVLAISLSGISRSKHSQGLDT
ncbi:MFS transporter [Chloroflexota bacterium]